MVVQPGSTEGAVDRAGAPEVVLGGVVLANALMLYVLMMEPQVTIPSGGKIKIPFYLPPAATVICMYAFGYLTLDDLWIGGFVGNEEIQPFSILVLFNALAYVCISVDATGALALLATKAISKVKYSGPSLFFMIGAITSTITVFTSNDITILVLTPIIFYACTAVKIDPLPLMIFEFFMANILSIVLIIGNPTNVIAGEALGVTFQEYVTWMILPGFAAAFTCVVVARYVFRKDLQDIKELPPPTQIPLRDGVGAVILGLILALTLVVLTFTHDYGLRMWEVCLASSILCAVHNALRWPWDNPPPPQIESAETYQGGRIVQDVERNIQVVTMPRHDMPTNKSAILSLPWVLLPFACSEFVLMHALLHYGWVSQFASLMIDYIQQLNSEVMACLLMSGMACLLSNVVNNQPATIFLTHVIVDPDFKAVRSRLRKGALYGVIMGSNFAANFTLVGALAGILWLSILKDKGIHTTFAHFSKFGFQVMPAVVVVSAVLCGWIIEMRADPEEDFGIAPAPMPSMP